MSNKDRLSTLLLQITMTAVVMAVLWFYWSILSISLSSLITNEDYSYGLLLPLVSGYIIYLKWPQIRSLLWRPSPLGLLLFAAGFSLFIVGEVFGEVYISRLSFLVVTTGLIFLIGGGQLFRLLLFPLFLLFIMLPLPTYVVKRLTLPLQLISSGLATAMLQMLGMPVFCQGNVIDLGVRQMQVVEACSGLRYILSLFALGVIFCYFFQRRLWKIVLLLLLLIPSAIVANALRVTGMGIWPALQELGFWHAFSGWLIFVFCVGILSLVNWILNKIQPLAPIPPDPVAPSTPAPRHALVMESYLLIALGLVFLAGPIANWLDRTPAVDLRQSFDRFPMELGSWRGQTAYVDPEMVTATGCDAYLNGDFSQPGQPSVNLWITYYGTQKKAMAYIHNPKICLVASGWTELDTGIGRIGKDMSVNYMIVEHMGNRMVVYYWFLKGGRWFTNEYLNKVYMGLDNLTRRRTDGCLVRLMTPAQPNIEEARKRLDAFVLQLAPVLPKFIPN